MKLRFEDWMALVDRACGYLAGCSVYDLDDCPFHDWYEDGVVAHVAARRALKRAGHRC